MGRIEIGAIAGPVVKDRSSDTARRLFGLAMVARTEATRGDPLCRLAVIRDSVGDGLATARFKCILESSTQNAAIRPLRRASA